VEWQKDSPTASEGILLGVGNREGVRPMGRAAKGESDGTRAVLSRRVRQKAVVVRSRKPDFSGRPLAPDGPMEANL